MKNKPKNVTDHRHYFVYTPDEIENDHALEKFRLDACASDDGSVKTYGVWDAAYDLWLPCATYEDACRVANVCAKMVREYLEQRGLL